MSEPINPVPPPRNTMDKLKSYHLFTWVSSKRDWMERCSLSQDQIAEDATKGLGFRVTRSNLKEVCCALGVVLPNKRGASTAPDLRQKLEAMDQRLLAMDQRLLAMDQRLQQTEQLLNEALNVQSEQGRVLAKVEGQLAAMQIPLTPLGGPVKAAPKLF